MDAASHCRAGCAGTEAANSSPPLLPVLLGISGVCRLFDGAAGRELCCIDPDKTVNASPVVFKSMIILGTWEGVYGIKVE